MNSFGTRLIVSLTACAALIVGAGMLLDYQLSRQEILQRVVKESADESRAVIDDLENWLSGIEGATRFLGEILKRQDYSRDDLRDMLHDVVANNHEIFGAAIALSPDPEQGRPAFAPYYYRNNGAISYADLSSSEADYLQQPWYREPATTGEAGWSEPYYDRGGGETDMTTFSVPVFRPEPGGGRSLYAVVTADVRLTDLQHVLAQLHAGDNSYSLLFSRAGVLMSSRSQRNVMQHYSEVRGKGMDNPSWPGLFQRALDGESASANIPCPEGDGICTLRMGRLQATGWPIALVYDQGEVLAPLHAYEVKTALISGITLLLMALAVYLITSRQTRPLRELTRAAEHIGRGEMDYPLPRARGNDEIARLLNAFTGMNRDLKSYIRDLANATASRSRLEGELAVAREIQMSMLPGGGEARLDEGCASLWAQVIPARTVGGDLYTWQRSDDKLWFGIGDVSDKGVPAALFMARASALLQQLIGALHEPEQVLAELNRLLARDNPSCMFLTLFLGVIDIRSGQLRFASAGHPAPSLLRGEAVRELEQASGPALGLAEDLEFSANALQLAAGDCLALYTDGVEEAFDADGNMFGVERLNALLRGGGDSVGTTGARILQALDEHAGQTPQHDDITLMLLRFWPDASDSFAPGPGITSRVLAWIDRACECWAIHPETAADLKLVAEEMVTNIDKYAGLPAGEQIGLQLVCAGDRISFEARDRGRPFNPLLDAVRAPLNAPIGDAAIGGLGVHLIASLSQRQQYRREHGQNILRVELQLAAAGCTAPAGADNTEFTGANRKIAMSLTTTVQLDKENSVARVLLDGALNTDTAPDFEKRLQAVVDEGHQLTVLDMRDLDYISSAGLRVIFKAAKQVHSGGRTLAAANRKPHIEKVFEILKALPDMTVFANEEELDDYLAHMQAKIRDQ